MHILNIGDQICKIESLGDENGTWQYTLGTENINKPLLASTPPLLHLSTYLCALHWHLPPCHPTPPTFHLIAFTVFHRIAMHHLPFLYLLHPRRFPRPLPCLPRPPDLRRYRGYMVPTEAGFRRFEIYIMSLKMGALYFASLNIWFHSGASFSKKVTKS